MQEFRVEFSYIKALAIMSGIIALGLVVANFFREDDNLGFLSIHFAAASCLLRIRSFFCTLGEREEKR